MGVAMEHEEGEDGSAAVEGRGEAGDAKVVLAGGSWGWA